MTRFLRGGLILAMLISCTVMAQNGTLKGRVTEATGAGSPLVTVKVPGTAMGVKSDMDGNYTLSLPAGQHKVTSLAVGKVSDTVLVTIVAGQTTTQNFTLFDNAAYLSMVTVTTTAKTGGEVAGVEEVKESSTMIVVQTAEGIEKNRDSDATGAVKKMPGVTIVGDSYIMIRGLNQRYNNVMLNDVFAPSVETDIKSFAFDIIPAPMIDRIAIYQTPGPDFTGEFAGGVVKVYTKSMPDSTFTKIGITTTYRQGSSFKTFLQPARSKWHWTGFNDGYNDMPSDMPYNINMFKPSGEYTLSDVGQSLNNNWLPDETNSLMDKTFNLTHGHRWMTKDSIDIGNITSITYTNNRTIYNSQRNDYNIYDYANDQSSYIYSFNDKQYTQMIRTGIINNWSVRFSDQHKIEFKNLFTAISTSQYINRTGMDYEFNYVPDNHSFNQVYRGLYSGQLMGEHLYNNDRTKFSWTTGFGYSYRDQPDYRRYRTDVDTVTGSEQIFIGVGVSPNYLGRFYSELRENSQTVNFAFEHKAEETAALKPVFKAGFFLERKDRTFRARNLGYVKSDFMNFDPNLLNSSIDSLFLPENINSTTGIKIAESTNPSDSYTASNYLAAAYFGTELNFTSRIKFNGGVRTEYNIQDLNSMTIGGVPVNVHNPILSVLPSVNVAYTLMDTNNVTMLLRLAYGKTVNRPEFRELAPFGFYDFNFNLVNKGSDSLKTPVIHNFDLRWELYPGVGEMITVGVFYKQFKNPIETLFIPGGGSGGIKTFTYGNAAMATSMGTEIEVRKSLDFSKDTSFLDNFSVIANASFIKSYVNLGQAQLGQSNERPMQGQSPYIVNAGLYYEGDNGFQANVLYNVVGRRIFIIGFDVYPDIYEMPRNILDFNFSKKFENNVEFRLSLGNVLNQKFVLLQDANADKIFDRNNDQIIQGYAPGSTATFGVSYTF